MNHIETSISDAVNRVATSSAPILFPDTCALLDLIRIPFGTKTAKEASRLLNAASQLVTLSHTPSPNLWIISPPWVHNEWSKHSQDVLEELEEYLSRLDNSVSVAHESANSVGIELPVPVTFRSRDIAKNLTGLSSSYFDNAIVLSEDSSCHLKAANRVKYETPPARRGGQYNDCLIIEHVLEFCSLLRKTGYNSKCVFITSNTRDFCESKRVEARDPLRSEFQAVDLLLVTRWDWAKAALGF